MKRYIINFICVAAIMIVSLGVSIGALSDKVLSNIPAMSLSVNSETYKEVESYIDSDISFTGYTDPYTLDLKHYGFKYKNLKCDDQTATLAITQCYWTLLGVFPILNELPTVNATGINGVENIWYGYIWCNVPHCDASELLDVDDYAIPTDYEIDTTPGDNIHNSRGEWIKYSTDDDSYCE